MSVACTIVRSAIVRFPMSVATTREIVAYPCVLSRLSSDQL